MDTLWSSIAHREFCTPVSGLRLSTSFAGPRMAQYRVKQQISFLNCDCWKLTAGPLTLALCYTAHFFYTAERSAPVSSAAENLPVFLEVFSFHLPSRKSDGWSATRGVGKTDGWTTARVNANWDAAWKEDGPQPHRHLCTAAFANLPDS